MQNHLKPTVRKKGRGKEEEEEEENKKEEKNVTAVCLLHLVVFDFPLYDVFSKNSLLFSFVAKTKLEEFK